MMTKVQKDLHPALQKVRFERTLCIIKPDGVMRGLIGEIIHRFERTGLKVVGMKMIIPTKEQAEKHYSASDEALLMRIGNNTHVGFQDIEGTTVKEVFGNDDPIYIGREIVQTLVDFLCSGPVVCMVVEGVQAISMVRKLAGNTLPSNATVGTIRGDYSVDSSVIANSQLRAIHNLLHASGNKDEAELEIKLWFKDEEIHSYKLGNEETMYARYY